MFEPCNVVECLGHFNGIVPSITCVLTKQHGVCGGKYFLKNPCKRHFRNSKFQMSLDALALKNLCLGCEFQSCLLCIISLIQCDNKCPDLNNRLLQNKVQKINKCPGHLIPRHLIKYGIPTFCLSPDK